MSEWQDFLVNAPPGQETEVVFLTEKENATSNLGQTEEKLRLNLPELELYCEQCNGLRKFQSLIREAEVKEKTWRNIFLLYQCRNCLKYEKHFAVRIFPGRYKGGQAIKLGEWPSFGPRVSSRTISLIGPDRELFLKGRRAESLGLGVGAYAYYRQVVENQKDRILDEIVKVAERSKVTQDSVQKIREAKQETQFSKGIEQIKDVLPEVLKINGHNPLVLLHKALSQGLHAGTDEQCLQIATDIRVVLGELAERIQQILKDQTELQAAVSRLLKV